jgi:hypothetical protein
LLNIYLLYAKCFIRASLPLDVFHVDGIADKAVYTTDCNDEEDYKCSYTCNSNDSSFVVMDDTAGDDTAGAVGAVLVLDDEFGGVDDSCVSVASAAGSNNNSSQTVEHVRDDGEERESTVGDPEVCID